MSDTAETPSPGPAGTAATSPQPQEDLYYVEYNPTASETIILLHGLFCSHLEWEHVVPHLSDQYHVIVPDQPQHNRSRSIAPFTLVLAADKVASLVRKHAHGGRAHVVGLSLGGFTTQELIRRHPDLVTSAFVTGATPFTPAQTWLARRSGIIHWGLWFMMATRLYNFTASRAGLLPHVELQKHMAANNATRDLAADAYSNIAGFGWVDVEEVAKQVKQRVLCCAGGQQDDVEGTRKLARIIRSGGVSGEGEGSSSSSSSDDSERSQSKAYVVRKAIHGWDLHFPELFAQGVKSWIRQEAMPEDFEVLE